MSIITEKSVGDIIYQLVDDIYPVHSADTGTICISSNGDIYTCDGGYIWATYNKKNSQGEIFSYDHNDTTFTPTLDTWFIPGIGATTPYTANTANEGFTLVGTSSPELVIDAGNVGRYLTIANITNNADNAGWNQINWAPSRNSVIPFRYNYAHFGTDAQGDTCNITSPLIYELDSRQNDSMFFGYRVAAVESGTAYLNRTHTKLSVITIEEPVLFFDTGISEDFNTNNWVVVNDSTNQWFMGTATTFSGGGTSIYISNDGGVSNTYTNTITQVSHFYKDITFPKNIQSDVKIDFYWQCDGESTLDYGKIYLAPTTETPVAGTELADTYLIGQSLYNNQNSFSDTGETITIGRSEVLGKEKRLIFSWVNDGSGGTNPPMAIDSLRLLFYVDENAYELQPTNTEDWEEGDFDTNGWAVVNDTENVWVVGIAESSGTSLYSTYISNDGGTSATYNKDNGDVSHFYKDFTFTGATTLSFDWKCWGEDGGAANNWDYGAVVITSTATTPVSAAEVITTAPVSGASETRVGAWSNDGKFNEGYGGSDANWRHESINLNAYSGSTKRLVFTFKNDGSLGDDPPFVVDNIKITGIGNWASTLVKIN